jgi:hypothetical protein
MQPNDVLFLFPVAGELWTERVMLYYVDNVAGAWLDKGNIKSVVIDEKPGKAFGRLRSFF